MDAATYVEAFPRNLPLYEEGLRPGMSEASVTQSALWSYRFGKYLHDYMANPEQDTSMKLETAKAYVYWTRATIGERIDLFNCPVTDYENRSTSNFHSLNGYMLDAWKYVIGRNWTIPHRPRARTLQVMQDSLSHEAMLYLSDRQSILENEGGHAFFEGKKHKLSELQGMATGVMQEFDAAIVVLEAMRRGNLRKSIILLPAPVQFKKTNAHVNASFIVLDTETHRSVGVKVRSRLQQDGFENADPERVVFIDGNTDFNNVRPVRYERTSTREKYVSWPGIVAAKNMCRIELSSNSKHQTPIIAEIKQRAPITTSTRNRVGGVTFSSTQHDAQALQLLQSFQIAKQRANEVVGSWSFDFAAAAKLVGERIAAKLQAD